MQGVVFGDQYGTGAIGEGVNGTCHGGDLSVREGWG